MKLFQDLLPALYAAGAAFSISALMSIYDEKPIAKTATGALSCGILTLAIAGSLELFDLPDHSVTFIGAAVGFIGAEKVRNKILSLFERRNSGDKNNDL